MDTADINSRLIDSYMSLLKKLSPQNKRHLISRLKQSVKTEEGQNQEAFFEAFGEWEGNENAEDLIRSIRESRTFNRRREEI